MQCGWLQSFNYTRQQVIWKSNMIKKIDNNGKDQRRGL